MLSLVLAAIVLAVASLIGFPGAHWGMGAFAVAIIPALMILVILSGRGPDRR
jgi:hypothetical protein